MATDEAGRDSGTSKHEPIERDWKWRYSFWAGLTYGPIPVGSIIVLMLAIFLAIYMKMK